MDDALIIIASLNSRIDDLEKMVQDGGNVSAPSVEVSALSVPSLTKTPPFITQPAIGDVAALTCANERLSKRISELEALSYCKICGEHTQHVEYGYSHHHSEDSSGNLVERLDTSLKIKEVCTQCAIACYVKMTFFEGKIDSNSTAEMQAKLQGYQKVILELTDKLAEAYGVKR